MTDYLSKKEMAEIMPGFAYSKPRAKPTHKEADLHLAFCKWIKKEYPHVPFIRHEKEKARTPFLRSLLQVYNNLDGIPDFEATFAAGLKNGLYVEFKKPGEGWLMADGKTVKTAYRHQAGCHRILWRQGRCAYFCNDLEIAKELFRSYLNGEPFPQQEYTIPELA